MVFNIFKTLFCAFLIFLSCFIADVRGKSITELKEINAAEFDLQELSSKVIQETTSDESVRVSIADRCESNPCENGGSCTAMSDALEEGFYCECPVGYTGEKCEIDSCSLLQCRENEICVVENENVQCKLIEDKDECDGMNCQNNGTCYIMDGKAACKCPDGYTGDECEKVDLCSEVCGENPGVVCNGDKTNRDAIMCFCKDEEKIFDQDEKNCKVKEVDFVDLCSEICGENPGVACVGDKPNPDAITCYCEDEDKIFDQQEKECKVNKVDFVDLCSEICGENPGVVCVRNKTKPDAIICYCEDEDKIFDQQEKECKVNKDECDTVKCLNGGICNIIDGKAVCDCPIGYTGDVCEKHPCTNDPCLNGGQCIVTGTTFSCICKEPYFGKFCETNLCDQYICKNGGTCKVIRKQPKCFCKEPYSGKFCDIRMDDCVTNFCENGGICRTMNGEPKCFCTEPYGGKFCNTRTDLRYNSTVFAVVYMLLGLVLISIGVLISCLLCRRICLGSK